MKEKYEIWRKKPRPKNHEKPIKIVLGFQALDLVRQGEQPHDSTIPPRSAQSSTDYSGCTMPNPMKNHQLPWRNKRKEAGETQKHLTNTPCSMAPIAHCWPFFSIFFAKLSFLQVTWWRYRSSLSRLEAESSQGCGLVMPCIPLIKTKSPMTARSFLLENVSNSITSGGLLDVCKNLCYVPLTLGPLASRAKWRKTAKRASGSPGGWLFVGSKVAWPKQVLGATFFGLSLFSGMSFGGPNVAKTFESS